MTVPVQLNRNSYQGNGVTVDFTYSWFYSGISSDLVVELSYASTGLPVLPQPILDTDYSVTPNDGDNGATITFFVPPAAGINIVIFGNPPVDQLVELVSGGILPAEAIESALDKTILIIQRIEDLINRMPQIADTAQNWINNQIIPQAGFLLAIDSTNQNVVAVNPNDIPSSGYVYASIFKDDYVANASGQFSFIPGVTTQLLLRQNPIIVNNTIIAFDGEYINKSRYSVSGDIVTFTAPIQDGVNIVEINMNAVVLGMNAPGADTVNSNAYITQSITARAIADQTITATQIADQTITATQIADQTITAAQIADDTLTGTQIADASIPPSKLTNYWPPMYIQGLNISPGTTPSTQFNISPGVAKDSTNSADCTLVSAITNASISSDTASGGVVPTAIFPITTANSGTGLYMFLAFKADGRTAYAAVDNSVDGVNVLNDPTLVAAGYVYVRRLAITYSPADGTFRPISTQDGRTYYVDNIGSYVVNYTSSTTPQTIAPPIPLCGKTILANLFIYVDLETGGQQTIVTSFYPTNGSSPGAGYQFGCNLQTRSGTAWESQGLNQIDIQADTLGKVNMVSNLGGMTVYINCQSFVDPRNF